MNYSNSIKWIMEMNLKTENNGNLYINTKFNKTIGI